MFVFIVTKYVADDGSDPYYGALGKDDPETHGVYLSEDEADKVAEELDDNVKNFASVRKHEVVGG
jgi:hypothetical protein